MASSYFMLKILKRKRIARKRRELEELLEVRNKYEFSESSILADFKKCRICLKKEGRIPIYGDDSAPDISDNVRTLGDIEINEQDDYPKHLCYSCHSLLESAVQFRKLAQETTKHLELEKDQKPLDLPMETDIHSSTEHENDTENYVAKKMKLCKVKFKTREDYLSHEKSKQHTNVRIQCKICLRLLTPKLYKRHVEGHKTTTHICEVCGKICQKRLFARHLRLHSFELPYQCEVCPYRGRFWASLKLHMFTHTGEKPHACDKCEARFVTRSNLNKHLLTHNKERPLKCLECNKGFYTKRELDAHFISIHAGIKDFACKICGVKYGTRKAATKHELRVHKREKMCKGRFPLYMQEAYKKIES